MESPLLIAVFFPLILTKPLESGTKSVEVHIPSSSRPNKDGKTLDSWTTEEQFHRSGKIQKPGECGGEGGGKGEKNSRPRRALPSECQKARIFFYQHFCPQPLLYFTLLQLQLCWIKKKSLSDPCL